MRKSSLDDEVTLNDAAEYFFRSAWSWIAVLVGCYALSWCWMREMVVAVPYVLLAAPSGLFHLIGIPQYDHGPGVIDSIMMHHYLPLVLLLAAHTGFWWAMIYLLLNRRGMHRTALLRLGWTLILLLAANMIGCATMHYDM
jgi:hypothetical protein